MEDGHAQVDLQREPVRAEGGDYPSVSSVRDHHGRGHRPAGADGRTFGRGDAGAQARRCLEIIAAALDGAGGSLRHVVRTRILLTRIDDWQAVAAVHGEVFRDIRPVNTIMQVVRFIDPDWLVEIEADAVIDDA